MQQLVMGMQWWSTNMQLLAIGGSGGQRTRETRSSGGEAKWQITMVMEEEIDDFFCDFLE